MAIALAFSPAGRILPAVADGADADGAEADGAAVLSSAEDSRLRQVLQRLPENQAEALFLLAAQRWPAPLPPTVAYWRDFAAHFLTALCHRPPRPLARPSARPLDLCARQPQEIGLDLYLVGQRATEERRPIAAAQRCSTEILTPQRRDPA